MVSDNHKRMIDRNARVGWMLCCSHWQAVLDGDEVADIKTHSEPKQDPAPTREEELEHTLRDKDAQIRLLKFTHMSKERSLKKQISQLQRSKAGHKGDVCCMRVRCVVIVCMCDTRLFILQARRPKSS